MPLPTKDAVAFRGIPPLGAEKKMALIMTFTQKQVEAMFARQAALKDQNSSQCPLEIDFDDNKIYIGDIATPFTRFKEVGTREICQRSPTVSKPLAGISLSGIVIGKLNMQRDFDQDVADNVRKATEAEHSKRNERTIVPLENPPVVGTRKGKLATGASALAKKAMSNRIVSAQAASNRPPASSGKPSTQVISSSTTPRATPPKSTRPNAVSSARPSTSTSTQITSSASTSTEPDLTSLRAHLTHYLALEERTTQQVLLEVGGRNPGPDTVREIEDTLTVVAEEIPPPKKGVPGPVKWKLRNHSWELVRPYEWPSLTPEQRTRMARKGRLAFGQMGMLQTEPLWEHFKTRVSDINVVPPPSSRKGNAKATLVKKSDFKGGMFPKEKKPSTKGGGVASGGITKVPAAKAKAKKEQEDGVEAKARKVVATLAADAKGKGKAGTSSTAKRTAKVKVVAEEEEEEDLPLIKKTRPSSGSVKKESSPLPPKSHQVQDESTTNKRKRVDADIDVTSDMEEGELPAKVKVKKRKVVSAGEALKPNKQKESRERPTKSTKEKILVKDESVPPKQLKDGSAALRPNTVASSSKAAPSGSKGLRLEKEEWEREERCKEREPDMRRSVGKRGRRATPSFSSDEEEAEAEKKPAASSRAAATSKAKQSAHPPTSSKPAAVPKPAAAPPPRAPAPSSAMPTDKDALRRQYHTCYARYMGVTSKVHEQRAKIEEALVTADRRSMSADEDVDMMDAEQLMQLRGEHERLRDELERIQQAHAVVF